MNTAIPSTSNYFSTLVDRNLYPEQAVRPWLPSRFESQNSIASPGLNPISPLENIMELEPEITEYSGGEQRKPLIEEPSHKYLLMKDTTSHLQPTMPDTRKEHTVHHPMGASVNDRPDQENAIGDPGVGRKSESSISTKVSRLDPRQTNSPGHTGIDSQSITTSTHSKIGSDFKEKPLQVRPVLPSERGVSNLADLQRRIEDLERHSIFPMVGHGVAKSTIADWHFDKTLAGGKPTQPQVSKSTDLIENKDVVNPMPISSRLVPTLPKAVSGSDKQAPAPTIQISIGRIEVRATQPTKSAKPSSGTQTRTMSLDDYLKQRGER